MEYSEEEDDEDLNDHLCTLCNQQFVAQHSSRKEGTYYCYFCVVASLSRFELTPVVIAPIKLKQEVVAESQMLRLQRAIQTL